MLLPLMFHILTPHAPMLQDSTPHDKTLHGLTAIDMMLAGMAGGMTDETLATMHQKTTAEAGLISTETETVVGLETISDYTATVCTLALVAVVSGE